MFLRKIKRAGLIARTSSSFELAFVFASTLELSTPIDIKHGNQEHVVQALAWSYVADKNYQAEAGTPCSSLVVDSGNYQAEACTPCS